MEFKERLLYYIERELFMSVIEFEKKCNIPQGTVNRAINGTNIGIDKIEQIALTYPDLDMDWLIRGKDTTKIYADTLREYDNQDTMNDPNVTYSHTPTIAENLTQALLTFAKNDQIRAKNEQTLIQNTEKLMEIHQKTIDLITEKLNK